MLVSLQWIKKYVELPDHLSGDEIAHTLTLATVEVESAERLAARFDRITVGKVTAVSPHPKADRLRIVDVSLGDRGLSRVVCGGINLYPDQLVAVAEPGSYVRWHGQGEPVLIEETTLRGVRSQGMICASAELGLEGLYPQASDAEILDLSQLDARAGDALAAALDLDDVLFEIDNKSLTNRPDLWGHYGIARELAALFFVPLRPITEFALPDLPQGFPVQLPDPACRRYVALSIDDVAVTASPAWLRTALWKVGVRPMNLPVDITNYVMLSTGQPTHAFDADRLDSFIRVRRAEAGEQLTLLNGETLQLQHDDLLIADAGGPLGMAGIMGGEDDSVHTGTTRVLLEIANFDPGVIRRSTQRHGLRTEASVRFEKSIDTQRIDLTLAESAALFTRLIPGCRLTALTNEVNEETKQLTIDVGLDFLETRLGRQLEAEEAARNLERLGFGVTTDKNSLSVAVPSWRATGDIEQRDDLLEEIARMIGYSNFPYRTPKVDLDPAPSQPRYRLLRRIRETMAFRYGFQEIFTYPWVSDDYRTASGMMDDALRLATPPSPDRGHLRSSLIPGLLASAAGNLRWQDSFRIFELTQVFHPARQPADDVGEQLPVMRYHLGAAIAGSDGWTLYRETKGMLEALSLHAQFAPLTFAAGDAPWAETAVCQRILYQGNDIGRLGLVKPQTARQADIKFAAVVLFELDLDQIIPLPSRENRFAALPAFPLVDADLSALVDESVSWREISDTVAPLVHRLIFIGEYRGPQAGAGKKSVTLRVWLESKDGTLTAEAIESSMKMIMQALQQSVGAEFRGA